MRKYTYRDTMYACYFGYVTQAINNNLAPLLFVVFQDQFHISLEMIGTLILMNFVTQIIVDLLAVKICGRYWIPHGGVPGSYYLRRWD